MKQHNWLQTQGIGVDIATQHGLIYNGSGAFTYPSGGKNSRRRILFINSKQGAKNIWDNDTRHLPMPPLFNIRCLTLPESRERGVYLSNGEKSTFAMHTAGIVNVVNTFGEGNKITESIAVLLQHGITRLMVIPDCDTPGLRAAWRWKELSADTPLNVEFLDLRLYLETEYGMTPAQYDKWDTRDLWLHLHQNKAAFQQALNDLPPLDFARYRDDLPTPPKFVTQPLPPPRAKQPRNGDIDFAAAYDAWWYEVVIPTLDQKSPPPPRGKHRHCPNPAHADRHPSFRISERGVPQCTCGIQYEQKPREKIAAWVGATSWEDYKQDLITAQKHAPRSPQTAPPARKYHFAQGIPDTLREAFLGLKRGGFVHDHAPALIVYEVWHEGILLDVWTPDTPRTVADVEELASSIERNASSKTIRIGIAQLVALGFFAEIEPLSQPLGRPIKRYQPQPLDEALDTFRQHLKLRLRERLFADTTPDTVQAEWFPELTPDKAQKRADYENQQRADLYTQTEEQRAEIEARRHEAHQRIRETFSLSSLREGHSSELPEGPWDNGRAYRDAYYLLHAQRRIARKQTITRERAARQIGVTPRTLGDIRERVGIIAVEQFQEIPLEISDAKDILEKVDNLVPWAAGRRFGRWIVSSSGRGILVRPHQQEWMEHWTECELDAGHKLSLKVQVASQEREVTEEDIQRREEMRAFRREQNEKRRAVEEEKEPRPRPEHLDKLPPLPPPEQLSPRYLTPRYVETQLRMSSRDDLVLYALLELDGEIDDLFPFSSSVERMPPDKGCKKGNKSHPEEDDPPDTAEDT